MVVLRRQPANDPRNNTKEANSREIDEELDSFDYEVSTLKTIPLRQSCELDTTMSGTYDWAFCAPDNCARISTGSL